jgi:hypothetical protein
MVARNASAVGDPTPGTVVWRRPVGSVRTSSSRLRELVGLLGHQLDD